MARGAKLRVLKATRSVAERVEATDRLPHPFASGRAQVLPDVPNPIDRPEGRGTESNADYQTARSRCRNLATYPWVDGRNGRNRTSYDSEMEAVAL